MLRVRRLNLADGEPFALVTVWCPEEYGAELCRADVGAVAVLRAARRAARRGRPDDRRGGGVVGRGRLLQVPVGSPVLRCERVTRSLDGEPVLLSEHVFPAHLTVFVVDLPHVEASIAPTGLRLVE